MNGQTPAANGLVVLDTNIALDVLVFDDPAALPLREALQAGSLQWIATGAMRDELARVLGYPQIVPRLAFYRLSADDVLAAFDRLSRPVDAAPKAPPTCTDRDDQIFIDLAQSRRSRWLLTRDRALLKLARRAAAHGVTVCTPESWLARRALANADHTGHAA